MADLASGSVNIDRTTATSYCWTHDRLPLSEIVIFYLHLTNFSAYHSRRPVPMEWIVLSDESYLLFQDREAEFQVAISETDGLIGILHCYQVKRKKLKLYSGIFKFSSLWIRTLWEWSSTFMNHYDWVGGQQGYSRTNGINLFTVALRGERRGTEYFWSDHFCEHSNWYTYTLKISHGPLGQHQTLE